MGKKEPRGLPSHSLSIQRAIEKRWRLMQLPSEYVLHEVVPDSVGRRQDGATTGMAGMARLFQQLGVQGFGTRMHMFEGSHLEPLAITNARPLSHSLSHMFGISHSTLTLPLTALVTVRTTAS